MSAINWQALPYPKSADEILVEAENGRFYRANPSKSMNGWLADACDGDYYGEKFVKSITKWAYLPEIDSVQWNAGEIPKDTWALLCVGKTNKHLMVAHTDFRGKVFSQNSSKINLYLSQNKYAWIEL
jgi:uncharacterized protein YecE (DUF72 family)